MSFMTAGIIAMWDGASVPTGWLYLDGTSYLKADYPALDAYYSARSYPYGSDATHFTVADWRGYGPFGKTTSGTGSTLGGKFGSLDHTHSGTTLTAVSHTHDYSHYHLVTSTATAGGNVTNDGGGTAITSTQNTSTTGAPSSTAISGSTGSANSPSVSCHFVIKT